MNLMQDKNFIDDLLRKWTLRENPYILFTSLHASGNKKLFAFIEQTEINMLSNE